jgi:hypothetical protein
VQTEARLFQSRAFFCAVRSLVSTELIESDVTGRLGTGKSRCALNSFFALMNTEHGAELVAHRQRSCATEPSESLLDVLISSGVAGQGTLCPQFPIAARHAFFEDALPVVFRSSFSSRRATDWVPACAGMTGGLGSRLRLGEGQTVLGNHAARFIIFTRLPGGDAARTRRTAACRPPRNPVRERRSERSRR